MVAEVVKFRHVSFVQQNPSEALRRHSNLQFIITLVCIFLYHHIVETNFILLFVFLLSCLIFVSYLCRFDIFVFCDHTKTDSYV